MDGVRTHVGAPPSGLPHGVLLPFAGVGGLLAAHVRRAVEPGVAGIYGGWRGGGMLSAGHPDRMGERGSAPARVPELRGRRRNGKYMHRVQFFRRASWVRGCRDRLPVEVATESQVGRVDV